MWGVDNAYYKFDLNIREWFESEIDLKLSLEFLTS